MARARQAVPLGSSVLQCELGFHAAPDAIRYLAEGHATGKIVVTV
jgi:NADPH-dependent curcumin reductase CurA